MTSQEMAEYRKLRAMLNTELDIAEQRLWSNQPVPLITVAIIDNTGRHIAGMIKAHDARNTATDKPVNGAYDAEIIDEDTDVPQDDNDAQGGL